MKEVQVTVVVLERGMVQEAAVYKYMVGAQAWLEALAAAHTHSIGG